MAFETEVTRAPTEILDFEVQMTDIITEETPRQAILIRYNIEMSTGEVVHREINNLAPHITATQIAALSAFMDAMRVQLNAEVLP